MSQDQILEEVGSHGIKLVELTGGEPLAQPRTPGLAQALLDQGYSVLIETSGSEPIRTLPPKVHVIMDIKCPDSGMAAKNLWENVSMPTQKFFFIGNKVNTQPRSV